VYSSAIAPLAEMIDKKRWEFRELQGCRVPQLQGGRTTGRALQSGSVVSRLAKNGNAGGYAPLTADFCSAVLQSGIVHADLWPGWHPLLADRGSSLRRGVDICCSSTSPYHGDVWLGTVEQLPSGDWGLGLCIITWSVADAAGSGYNFSSGWQLGVL